MRKVNYIYLILFSALFFAACSSDDVPGGSNDRVELSYAISNFDISGTTTRATDVGSPAEQQIDNLYLFLFDMTGANSINYYVDNSFSDGTWNKAGENITLKLTQAEAGERRVYVLANVSAALQTALSGVTTLTQLQAALETTDTPWSPTLVTPILMSGNATHNFVNNRKLSSVPLIRALAKIELNVKLTPRFQVVPTINSGNITEYRYRYVDFDTRTYVVKPMPTKPANLASSSADAWPNTAGWTPWGALLNGATPPDAGTGYTLDNNGKVTGLRLITYLNERDEASAVVEIELPRVDTGPLPPPEFGPELYRLPMPDKVERNTWYRYDIEI